MEAVCSSGFNRMARGSGSSFIVIKVSRRRWRLAPYPQVSLLDARTRRDDVKVKIRSGIDPAAEKRLAEITEPGPGDTFKEIALEFIAKCRRDNLAGPTMVKKEWLLDFAYAAQGCSRS